MRFQFRFKRCTDTRVVSDQQSRQPPLFSERLRVHPGFAAVRDVHSNSYRLPPAVQSVLLQWTFPLPSCIVCGSAWHNRETQTPLCPVCGPAWARSWSKEFSGLFLFSFFFAFFFFFFPQLPRLVRTALSAVWAWRMRSPWDRAWWWSRWPEACQRASASGTWAGAAAGPGSWTALIHSATEDEKGGTRILGGT